MQISSVQISVMQIVAGNPARSREPGAPPRGRPGKGGAVTSQRGPRRSQNAPPPPRGHPSAAPARDGTSAAPRMLGGTLLRPHHPRQSHPTLCGQDLIGGHLSFPCAHPSNSHSPLGEPPKCPPPHTLRLAPSILDLVAGPATLRRPSPWPTLESASPLWGGDRAPGSAFSLRSGCTLPHLSTRAADRSPPQLEISPPTGGDLGLLSSGPLSAKLLLPWPPVPPLVTLMPHLSRLGKTLTTTSLESTPPPVSSHLPGHLWQPWAPPRGINGHLHASAEASQTAPPHQVSRCLTNRALESHPGHAPPRWAGELLYTYSLDPPQLDSHRSASTHTARPTSPDPSCPFLRHSSGTSHMESVLPLGFPITPAEVFEPL